MLRIEQESMTPTIPLAVPDLSELEERYVLEAVRSTWISSTGPFVEEFEAAFARMCGTRTAISVCNGTVALHLALLALDVRPGDEVLVPSLTYIATANAVRYVGGEPVFVDVDPDTWCIDPSKIEEKITRRTRGIIPVHLYGHPADMDAINHIAAVHGLWVVEDAAEAHTALYKDRPTGGLSPVATFSFYGNKIFTSGEGGALTMNDRHLEVRTRTLRGQGVDPSRRYYFPVTGYNFRLTNVACALLCAQMQRQAEILAARHRVFDWYRELLTGVDGLDFQKVASWARPAPWLFNVLIGEGSRVEERERVARALADAGIETRPFFVPLHTLPPFREESRQRGDLLPVTETLAARGLSLPTHARLTQDNISYIADTLRRALR
jgi:perosamine synthetase